MRFELDFSHGQEKDITQKEECRQEKTNFEKINQKKGIGKEEASEEGCCPEIHRKTEACGEEEIRREEEACRKESHASTRGRDQPHNSQRTSWSGRLVRWTVRRYAGALAQKL